MMNTVLDYLSLTDGRLVELHLGGDREAFRQIVNRYQAMVCAFSFSACGDVGRSEDVAQEVFLAAWKELPALREPEKLRAWLAGIARNLIRNSFRRDCRTPTSRAEPLLLDVPSDEHSPREEAMSADEASLLWKALSKIPENYREPMVLFYREQCSVNAVAVALEISDESVRQRLVRGRAMLSERMAKLVAETLVRSAPTSTFAGAVLLAVPSIVTPAAGLAEAGIVGIKTATGGAGFKTSASVTAAGMAVSKGGLMAKGVSLIGLLPVLIHVAMEFLKFRTEYEVSGSNAKRRLLTVTFLAPNLLAAVFVVGGGLLTLLRRPGFPLAGVSGKFFILGLVVLLVVTLAASVLLRRWKKRIQREESGIPLSTSQIEPSRVAQAFEYRSPRFLLGMPLIHVKVGGPGPIMKRTARGWIAVTDGIAIGGLFGAGGQLAVAPLSFAPAAIGILSLGFFNLGIWAVGFMAGGIYAYGGGAFGVVAAKGGFAMSKAFAAGSRAFGPHANDAAAVRFFHDNLFFGIAETALGLIATTIWFAWLPSLVLTSWYLWRKRTANRSAESVT